MVIDHHKDEISDRAEKLSGAKSGSKQWLGYYSVAVGEIMEELTSDQMDEYRSIAEEGQTTSRTVEEQCR